MEYWIQLYGVLRGGWDVVETAIIRLTMDARGGVVGQELCMQVR